MSNLSVMAARAAALAQPVGASPWREVADTAEYTHRRGSIEVPAADGSLNVIVSFSVQPGYAAVLTAVLFNFSGQVAPQEGNSADVLYSLRVDSSYFPRDFGSINTSLGSLANGPYPIPGGLRLKAGQTIEGLIQVPVNSPVSTGPGSFAICHLLGWQWPDRT